MKWGKQYPSVFCPNSPSPFPPTFPYGGGLGVCHLLWNKLLPTPPSYPLLIKVATGNSSLYKLITKNEICCSSSKETFVSTEEIEAQAMLLAMWNRVCLCFFRDVSSCCEGSVQPPENVQQDQLQHLVSICDSLKTKTYPGSLRWLMLFGWWQCAGIRCSRALLSWWHMGDCVSIREYFYLFTSTT